MPNPQRGLLHSRYATTSPLLIRRGPAGNPPAPPSPSSALQHPQPPDRALSSSRHATAPLQTVPSPKPPSPPPPQVPTPRASTPFPHTPTPAQARPKAAQLSVEKARRLLVRLKWKRNVLLLVQGVLVLPSPEGGDIVLTGNATEDEARDERERHRMLHLDFFEFYTLLERALVTLLEAFGEGKGLGRSRHAPHASSRPGPSVDAAVGIAEIREVRHAFHAQVLEAVGREGSPLGAVFGVDPVRGYLKAAKALRNKWKDYEREAASDGATGPDDTEGGIVASMLADPARLNSVLDGIVVAVEGALEISRQNAVGQTDEERDGVNDAGSTAMQWGEIMEVDAPLEIESGDEMDWQVEID